MAKIMNKPWCLVKFLNKNNDVVYQFIVKTCRPVRVVDIARSWLLGNDNMYRGVVVVNVECEFVDVSEVEY